MTGVRAYKKPPRNSRADILCAVDKVWPIGGLETPDIPDGFDVLDAGDALQGLRAHGWRRVVECVGLGGNFWWYLAT
jgi:hypothetical protein